MRFSNSGEAEVFCNGQQNTQYCVDFWHSSEVKLGITETNDVAMTQ